MNSEMLDWIIPISTFIIGHFWSWVWFRTRERSKKVKEAIEETIKLINDWYTQLQELSIKLNDTSKGEEVDRQQLILGYVNNRLLLPKILFNIELIKKNGTKKYKVILEKVNEFLELVTIENEVPLKDEIKFENSERTLIDIVISKLYPFDFIPIQGDYMHRTCRWLEDEDLAAGKLFKDLDFILKQLFKESAKLV